MEKPKLREITRCASINIRIDVDYPYPSRNKNFIYSALNLKSKKDYLKNSKIIARMVNESKKSVMVYWFFTPLTIPDKELLDLLNPERHDVGLHIATDPYAELENLEKSTDRKVKYYTIHGTSRLLARLLWGRKLSESIIEIPDNFPLENFHVYHTFGLDVYCYKHTLTEALNAAGWHSTIKAIVHIHPEWLFQSGTFNHRGRYYEVLKTLLEVDSELDTFAIHKKGFIKAANDSKEYEHDVIPNEQSLNKLAERGIDVFSFIERGWCCPIQNPPKMGVRTEDNVAMLKVKSFKDWWESVGKKTRNMVRKAEKSGIKISVIQPDGELAEGIWRIYNETPIRQDRAFPHYGISHETVKNLVLSAQKSTFIGAYLQDELVGFIQLTYGDKIAIITQILSLQKYWDKAINNALLAKAIEVVAEGHGQWLMYGRIGNHPSLDKFKQNNGFEKLTLNSYAIPLSRKGKIAIKLGLHKELKDALPQSIKGPLIPVFNWISRTKAKMRNW